jgi:hypothetical protein
MYPNERPRGSSSIATAHDIQLLSPLSPFFHFLHSLHFHLFLHSWKQEISPLWTHLDSAWNVMRLAVLRVAPLNVLQIIVETTVSCASRAQNGGNSCHTFALRVFSASPPSGGPMAIASILFNCKGRKRLDSRGACTPLRCQRTTPNRHLDLPCTLWRVTNAG